jgi:uncharacterized protein involved in oxidation of intracellular sulfur
MTDRSNNFTVAISCGTDNPNRATRGLFFAMVAKKQGKNVTVFLLDEAVHLARKGMADHVQAATGDAADDHLTFLREFEVPILVCTPCAKSRQIAEADLVEGARFASGDQLVDLACNGALLSL